MNTVKRAIAVILTAALALSFSGCIISSGIMTDEEAHKFFKEMKEIYSDPTIWEHEIEVVEDDVDREDAIGFLKEAMKLLEDNPQYLSGTFRGHRCVSAFYKTRISYNGKSYSLYCIILGELRKDGCYYITLDTSYGTYGRIAYKIKVG